uniref:fasciclin domain-containing protein n=2 Tax=unclassified Methanoculleus TaxID=2619537 RepID=UPI00272E8898
MRRNPTILGLVAALAIGLVALPVLAATADVEIRGGAYIPASLTVEGNTTVTWTNYGEVSHTVTSTGGLFDSGPIEENETFEHAFNDTGTYPYGCTLNASTQRTPMQGVVIVVPEGMMVAPAGNVTPGEEPANMTLADLVAENEDLASFAGAVEDAGLTRTVLATGGPYTVFAPDNAAFEALGNETLAGLSNDTETLDALLMHHVVRGNYTAEDLVMEANGTGNETVLETLAGDNLTVGAADGDLTIGNASIVASDITADNGIVHIIDTVLVPPGLVLSGNATPAGNETAEANVTIVEPMEGANVTAGDVTVSVDVTNFTLVEPTGQPNAAGEG